MKKKLNTALIENELKGSVFFPQQEASPAPLLPQYQERQPEKDGITISRYHDTTVSSNHDTMIPKDEEAMVEEVRKAVRQIGKEPATQRLTLEEKQALADIEYTYKRQGIKTSGNEIIRIATNYVVRDYQQHGEKSVLAKVLHKLNS